MTVTVGYSPCPSVHLLLGILYMYFYKQGMNNSLHYIVHGEVLTVVPLTTGMALMSLPHYLPGDT